MAKKVLLFGLSVADELNLTSRLKKAGYRIEVIPALERIHNYLLNEDEVGLVFDLDVYGEKLYSIISYVKKIAPRSKFVLVSSNATREAVLKARMAGADYYILKPFDPDIAASKIEKVFAELSDEKGEFSSGSHTPDELVKVFSVDGDLSSSAFDEIARQIKDNANNGARKIVFDLNSLETTAITVIAQLRRLVEFARENGADAAIVLDPEKELMKVIEDSGLFYDVKIYGKVEEATKTA